jgi:hypothetical protein
LAYPKIIPQRAWLGWRADFEVTNCDFKTCAISKRSILTANPKNRLLSLHLSWQFGISNRLQPFLALGSCDSFATSLTSDKMRSLCQPHL